MPFDTLSEYRQQTQRLLQDTRQARFNLQDLDAYINDARVQIALAAECIRIPASLPLVANQQAYDYSDATFIAAPTLPAGLGGIGSVRSARIQTAAGGYNNLSLKAWEWFSYFFVEVTAPVPGVPTHCSRLRPGAGTGTIWFGPIPDDAYTIILDTCAYPAPLTSNASPEALPVPWTDAVPFYAAYLALLSVGDKQSAEDHWAMYQLFEQRGTQITTPTRNPRSFPGGRGAGLAAQRTPLTGPAQPAPQRGVPILPQG